MTFLKRDGAVVPLTWGI